MRTHNIRYDRNPIPYSPDLAAVLERNIYGKIFQFLPNITILTTKCDAYTPEQMIEKIGALS